MEASQGKKKKKKSRNRKQKQGKNNSGSDANGAADSHADKQNGETRKGNHDGAKVRMQKNMQPASKYSDTVGVAH